MLFELACRLLVLEVFGFAAALLAHYYSRIPAASASAASAGFGLQSAGAGVGLGAFDSLCARSALGALTTAFSLAGRRFSSF